jgi:hypothetical protein
MSGNARFYKKVTSISNNTLLEIIATGTWWMLANLI